MLPGAPPAESAFRGLAAHYHRHRPDYPEEIFTWMAERLGLARGDLVADVGAGTGISTRRLLGMGLRVFALDLSAEMLSHARSDALAKPTVSLARAEQLPVRTGSLRAIFAAQAFHWFATEQTLAEWHRALGPSGGVGILWNQRDPEESAFVRAYEALIAEFNPEHRPGHGESAAAEVLQRTGHFADVEHREATHLWRLDAAGMVGFAHSVSYIANVLSTERLAEFDRELHALIRDHFPAGRVEIPLRCRAWVARRREG